MHTPADASTTTSDEATLRRAYLLMRRPHWGTFDEAMADPVFMRVVRSTAWRLAHGLPMADLLPAVQRPVTQAPIAPALPSHQPDPYDRKRAAAGDRDE